MNVFTKYRIAVSLIVALFVVTHMSCSDEPVQAAGDESAVASFSEFSPALRDRPYPQSVVNGLLGTLGVTIGSLQYDNPGKHMLTIEAYLYRDHDFENPDQVMNSSRSVDSDSEILPLLLTFQQGDDELHFSVVTENGSGRAVEKDVRAWPEIGSGNMGGAFPIGDRRAIYYFGEPNGESYSLVSSSDPEYIVKEMKRVVIVYATVSPWDEG